MENDVVYRSVKWELSTFCCVIFWTDVPGDHYVINTEQAKARSGWMM